MRIIDNEPSNSKPSLRTSGEIRRIFMEKGCVVTVRKENTNKRGLILIYAPGIDLRTHIQDGGGYSLAAADFCAADGPYCDGTVYHYDVWLVNDGEYVPATVAEYANARPEFRLSIEFEDTLYFIHRDEMESRGMMDMRNAFRILGV